MDSQAGAVGGYSGAHALTDLTLSLLQDSGWCAVVLFYSVILSRNLFLYLPPAPAPWY